MSGSRWQKYCWKCRDHWTSQLQRSESAEEADLTLSPDTTSLNHPWEDETPSWSFPQRVHGDVSIEETDERRQNVLLARNALSAWSASSLPSAPISIDTYVPPAMDQPRGALYEPPSTTTSQLTNPPLRRRPPRNPFGTREEWESPDYQSPLAGMFTRAWTRYADAEDTRQREEDSIRSSLRSIRQQRSNGTALDGAVPDSIYEHGGLLTDELRRVRQLAADMASAVETMEGYQIVAEPETTPTINPIDAQRRPPALTTEQMTISVACRICNEQKVDTLVEPCMHICQSLHFCPEYVLIDLSRYVPLVQRDHPTTSSRSASKTDTWSSA